MLKQILIFITLLALTSPASANLSCSNILSTNPKNLFTEILEVPFKKSKILIVATEQSLEVRIPNTKSGDLSLNNIIFALFGLSSSAPFESDDHQVANIKVHVSKNTLKQNVLQAAKHIEDILNLSSLKSSPPKSFSEPSSFESPSRLDQFHEDIASNVTPARFRNNYANRFSAARKSLPEALRAVMQTEYFLNSELNDSDLAVKIVRLTYGLNLEKAHELLESLSDAFIYSLLNNETFNFDLEAFIKPVINITPSNPTPARVRLSDSHSRVNTNTTTTYGEEPFSDGRYDDRANLRSHSSHIDPTSVRIDEIYPEIIDSIMMAQMHEDGVFNLLEFAQKYTGPALMYKLGLTRNEIRDLYYYIRSTYGLKLRIGQDFGITLNIFREF